MTRWTSVVFALVVLMLLHSALAIADEAAPPESVKPLAIEDLGVPVRTMRRSGDFLIPKPGGKGWWFLTSYNPMRRNPMKNQIFVIDLDSKKYRVVWGPPGGGLSYGWSNRGLQGPDGLYYISHYGKVGLYAFAPKDGSIEWIDYPQIKDRVSPFRMCLTPDGKIFMGTASGKAYLVSFDIRTRTFRNYGVPGPKRAPPMYVWSMAVGKRHVYCGMGKNPWTLVAVNRKTGAHTVLLGEMEMEYLTVSGGGDSCTATVKYRPDPKKKQTAVKYFRLKDGRAVEYEPEKGVRRAPKPKAAPRPELVLNLARPTSEGKAQIWFRLPGKDWDHVALEGIQTVPWKFTVLKALPDGRLIGAPRAYEDIFIYDPKVNKVSIVGKSTMSTGAIECVGGKVYLMGYPGTIVHEYDPARPWTYFTTTPTHKEPALTSPDSNPRFCARLGDITKTHHARGSAVGADGFIYVGGHAERLHVGGGLAWWNPVKRRAGGLREPFLLQDCAGLCAARDGRLIVYSSNPVADPRKKRPTPKEAKLFVLDTATKTIIAEIVPLPGMTNCGAVTAIGDRVFGVGRVGNRWTFYVVDLATRKTIFTRPLRDRAAQLKRGPDNNIYTFIGNMLTRINPKTFALQALGTVEKPGRLEFLGNDIYLTGYRLRRIRNATALK